MFCIEEKGHFFNLNTNSRISLCSRAQNFEVLKSRLLNHVNSISGIQNLVSSKINNDFIVNLRSLPTPVRFFSQKNKFSSHLEIAAVLHFLYQH